jgi:hypothetical protein
MTYKLMECQLCTAGDAQALDPARPCAKSTSKKPAGRFAEWSGVRREMDIGLPQALTWYRLFQDQAGLLD